MRDGLRQQGCPEMRQTVPSPDRALVGAMLAASGQIDVIIRRGGKGWLGVRDKAQSSGLCASGRIWLSYGRQADMKAAAEIVSTQR